MDEHTQSRALPFLGDSSATPEPASPVDREHGFLAIVKIFARTWPYLLPHTIGFWREIRLQRIDTHDPEASADDRAHATSTWSFKHVPPIVTALVALGPLTGLHALGQGWLHDAMWVTTLGMAAMIWVLLFVRGRVYTGVSLVLAVVGATAFASAVFVLEGYRDNFYVGLVCAACVCIWVFQYRVVKGSIRMRVRLGSHLIYYFVLLSASTLITMVLALFSVDLISQSILQAQPLTTFLAEFIGQPELAAPAAAGAVDGSANVELTPLTPDQRHGLTWVYGVFMVFVWLVQIPTSMLLPYYYIFIMQRVNQDLRSALVDRWHRLSLRYHSDHRVGDSVYRIYQDSAQVTAVVGMVVQALQLMIAYATGVVFLTALDPLLGLMTLSVIVMALLWGRWYSPRMRVKSLASREINSAFTSRVQETFAAVKLLKAYGTEAFEQERLAVDSVHAFNASYRVRTLMAVIGIVMFTLAAGVLLIGQYLTAVWAYGERETFATLLVALVGLSFVRWNLSAYNSAQEQLGLSSVALRDLVDRWTQAQDMAMGLNRVFDILDIEPDVQNRPGAKPMRAVENEIRFDGVRFAYEPDRPVLNDVSFSVEPGSICAIVGPTGSGKSSMVSLLFRLFDPDSGSISVDGIDLRELDLDSLRDNVSVALQENVLFGMSVRDNIRYVIPAADDVQVLAAARVACVDDYVESLPDGLDTVLSDRGGKLSTGQRQRLSIARAIAKDSAILILDEPTAALDADTEHRVLERLSEWGRDRVIFLITHRISTIQKADRLLYLDEGTIVENGTHAELMANPNGRYRRFVDTEARLSQREVEGDNAT